MSITPEFLLGPSPPADLISLLSFLEGAPSPSSRLLASLALGVLEPETAGWAGRAASPFQPCRACHPPPGPPPNTAGDAATQRTLLCPAPAAWWLLSGRQEHAGVPGCNPVQPVAVSGRETTSLPSQKKMCPQLLWDSLFQIRTGVDLCFLFFFLFFPLPFQVLGMEPRPHACLASAVLLSYIPAVFDFS